jgi:hypothetical protein
MAIAVVSATGGTSTSLSVTVSSPTNGYLLVAVRCSTEPTIARDGQNLAKIADYPEEYVFGIVAPNSGTANVVVTGGTLNAVQAMVMSGVDQTSPVITTQQRQWNGASPWAPSDITTEADGLVIHSGYLAAGGSYSTLTATGTTTSQNEVQHSSTYVKFLMTAPTTGSTGSTSFTSSFTGGVGESVQISFKPASGGGGGPSAAVIKNYRRLCGIEVS